MTDEFRVPLTEEDLFQLELLADGELDEESRRDLLERLDGIVDGWRQCALAFLQAQCLGESIDDGALLVGAAAGEPEETDASAFADAVLSAPSRSALGMRREPARAPEPLRTRGYRRTVTLISSACALLLVGLVGLHFFVDRADKPSVPGAKNLPLLTERAAPEESPVLTSEEEMAAESALKSPTDDFEAEPAAEDLADDLYAVNRMGAEPERGTLGVKPMAGALGGASRGLTVAAGSVPARTLSVAAEKNPKIQHITIRRPGGLNEISVPCVEAESYVSDNSAAEALAKNYRDAGCQVETLHEELEFRLQNGKSVIVPVDTIDVHRAPSRTYFL